MRTKINVLRARLDAQLSQLFTWHWLCFILLCIAVTSQRSASIVTTRCCCCCVCRLEQRLRDGIMSQLQGVVLNGPEDVQQHRYPGNVNLSFAYVEGESLIMGLKVRRVAVMST
jgi:cysteine sulfinate desulfinase/cysteine desulfurase-like protein